MSIQIPKELSRFKHYMLGIQELDTEHLDMFVLIYNSRFITKKEMLEANAVLLLEMWDAHVLHETDFMKSLGYPFIKSHASEHVKIHDRLSEFVDRTHAYYSGSKHNGFADIGEMFLYHLDNFDQQIFTFVMQQEKNSKL